MTRFLVQDLLRHLRCSMQFSSLLVASNNPEAIEQWHKGLCASIYPLRDLLIKLEMTNSSQLIPGIVEMLESKSGPQASKLGLIDRGVNQLAVNIERELASRIVLLMDAKAAALYEDDQPYGAEVARAFPLAACEVTYAARCIAFEQWTAAVFHLMRALESVLRAMARSLGVTLENPNWNHVLNHVDKIVKALDDDERKDGFYEEASIFLQSVRLAWRNPVTHIDARVPQQQARMVWQAVEIFMRHAATRISE